MKRDMNLVRDLLLEIEKHPGMNRVSQHQFEPGDFGITEENFETVAFHLDLMIEAGLVLGRSDMRMPIVSGLTWSGAEFLDAVRDSGTWKKTKEGAGKVGNWGLSFMLDLAKAIAKEEAKRRLGLSL
jgi:hypothetical protein